MICLSMSICMCKFLFDYIDDSMSINFYKNFRCINSMFVKFDIHNSILINFFRSKNRFKSKNKINKLIDKIAKIVESINVVKKNFLMF